MEESSDESSDADSSSSSEEEEEEEEERRADIGVVSKQMLAAVVRAVLANQSAHMVDSCVKTAAI